MLYRAYYSRTILHDYPDTIKPLVLVGMDLAHFLALKTPRHVAIAFDYVGDRSSNVR